MRVELVDLETLRAQIPVMTREMFVAQYPCHFLLAMGFLSAEEQRHGGTDMQEFTSPIILGEHLRHDAGKKHPLAGCAFSLWHAASETKHATIGRNNACDITVPENCVSEQHCILSLTAESSFVTDSGSTNGSTVNLDPLPANKPRQIHPEDIVTLGRYSFQFHSSGSLFDALQMLELIND